MILKTLIVIALLIMATLLFAAMKPGTFAIQRSLTIAAPADKIFPLINDFHNWSGWAPQDREDRSVVRTYAGAEQGVGAKSEWVSSGSAGKGQMEITESVPFSKIAVKVDFEKPFEAHNVNEFTLQPEGNSTRVMWNMRGTNVFMMKVMSIFMNMDRMMGKHFEAGLKNLKQVAEK